MEDKSFELLSKISSEMTEQFKVVREDINALKKDAVRLENNHGKKSMLYLMVTNSILIF